MAHDFYSRIGDLDASEGALDRAVAVSEATGNILTAAYAINAIGGLYFARGALDRAEQMHRKALLLFESIDNVGGISLAHSRLGDVLLSRGHLSEADVTYKMALAEAERGQLMFVADKYISLGLACLVRRQLDCAEEMYVKALSMCREEDVTTKAICLGNLGIVYTIRGDFSLATEHHHQSLAIDERLGRIDGMANNYIGIGLVAYGRGDLNEAKTKMEQASALAKSSQNALVLASATGNLGCIARDKGDLVSARKLWGYARDQFGVIGMPLAVALAIGNLHDINWS